MRNRKLNGYREEETDYDKKENIGCMLIMLFIFCLLLFSCRPVLTAARENRHSITVVVYHVEPVAWDTVSSWVFAKSSKAKYTAVIPGKHSVGDTLYLAPSLDPYAFKRIQ